MDIGGSIFSKDRAGSDKFLPKIKEQSDKHWPVPIYVGAGFLFFGRACGGKFAAGCEQRSRKSADALCARKRKGDWSAFFGCQERRSNGRKVGLAGARELRAKMPRTWPRPLNARKRKVDYFELWLTARLKPCPAMRRWPVSDWVKS